MTKSLSAGGVVLNRRGEVLVVNQNHDSWSLPKGHIDPGEDALTAAKREILEESGVSRLTLVRALGKYERGRILRGGQGEDPENVKVIEMYLFTTDQEELKPTDPHNPEARWVPVDQVAPLLTHPKDKDFFRGVAATLAS